MEKQDFYISNQDLTQKTQESTSGSWGKLAQCSLICALIEIVPLIATVICAHFFSWYVVLILSIVSFIVFSLMNYGYNAFMLEFTNSTTAKLSVLFSGFSKSFFKIIILHFVLFVLLVIAYSLFIVPGVFLTIRYSMTLFCLRENPKLSISKAMSSSAKLMKDNYVRLLKVFGINLKWILLGIVTLGIGFIWILPKYLTSKVIFYDDLKTDF